MLINYFKIAFRNLVKNKAYSFINIFGLAVGLTTCLLIMLYIFDESSFDKHHKQGGQVYRIASVSGKNYETWAASSAPLAWGIKNDLPEVEQITRLLTFPDISTMLLKYQSLSGEKQFLEPNCFYVDSTFFQVLSYDFIYGDANTALNEPNSMVMHDKMAMKFFGTTNAVGKIVILNTPFGEMNYTVKGVYRSATNKTHIPTGYFLSMRNSDMWNWVQNQTDWTSNNVFFTYVKLKPGTHAQQFEKKLNTVFMQYAGEGMKAAGFSKTLFIQPLKDIYLHSSIGNELGANGNITYLYILGSIAAFILLIACINFMNLATARSAKRAKEVGVRKVMGAEKAALVRQFLGESMIMCVLALIVALVLVWSLLPVFNAFTQKNLQPLAEPNLLIWITGLTLLTGLLSGLYPAFYLSSFKPISVLKGKLVNNFSATAIRKGLVVFQFTISICLVLAAIITIKQLNFLQEQHLGFNKEQKLVLPLQQVYKNSEASYIPLKNELLKNPNIKAVTCGSAYPGVANLTDMLFYPEGKSSKDMVDIHLSTIDADYIETLGFELLNGRPFSKASGADSLTIILNETAIQQLGYKVETAVGKKIQFDYRDQHGLFEIVGVVKDFNYESLHNNIKPYGFLNVFFGNKYGYLIAATSSSNYSGLLADVEKAWKKAVPNTPFVYSFLDQDFQRNYIKDQQIADIIIYFTVIAVIIACLGLFGLAAFSAEQRTREIGIRKVLGASVFSVTQLLSKEFARLVVISILIASPIAWYVMNQWLQNFAYKTSISWWMFVLAGFLALFIALLTVSFQAIKAALANPVKSLKVE